MNVSGIFSNFQKGVSMNDRKQIWCALFLGLVVCTASAGDVQKYGVTFEATANGVSNDFAYAIGDYIDNSQYGEGNTYRGMADGEPLGWFSGYAEDDESRIIERTDAIGGQALQLNTDASTLTNRLEKSVADAITAAILSNGVAYVEGEVLFVPSDTLDTGIEGGHGVADSVRSTRFASAGFVESWSYWLPPNPTCMRFSSSTSHLLALYAYFDEDAGSPTNLVVFHGVMDANGGITYTNEVFSSVTIDKSIYTKLRVEIRQFEDPLNPGVNYTAFSVKVGEDMLLSSPTALDARFGGTDSGNWFMTVEDRNLTATRLLSSILFKGTGEIDNIKVGVVDGATPLPFDPVPEDPPDPVPDSDLDYNRCHDGVPYDVTVAPYGWQRVDGSNYLARTPNGGTWKASGVGLGTTQRNTGGALGTSIGMDYPTVYFQNLPLSATPFIQSPKLVGGVGTIDFRSMLIGETIQTSEVTLQVTYTDNDPDENDWIDVCCFGYGTQNGYGFYRINHVVLNDYDITYVRILRTGYNFYSISVSSGRLAIDNICITKPAADVGIVEKLRNPGYPAADQGVRMRCAVTNRVETTPATNRHVSVKYQYVARETAMPVSSATAWSSSDMAYMGKDDDGLDWYEGTIPAQKVGYVWYYYQVDYDGYNYGENPLNRLVRVAQPGLLG